MLAILGTRKSQNMIPTKSSSRFSFSFELPCAMRIVCNHFPKHDCKGGPAATQCVRQCLMAPRNLPRTCGNALALPFSRHGLCYIVWVLVCNVFGGQGAGTICRSIWYSGIDRVLNRTHSINRAKDGTDLSWLTVSFVVMADLSLSLGLNNDVLILVWVALPHRKTEVPLQTQMSCGANFGMRYVNLHCNSIRNNLENNKSGQQTPSKLLTGIKQFDIRWHLCQCVAVFMTTSASCPMNFDDNYLYNGVQSLHFCVPGKMLTSSLSEMPEFECVTRYWNSIMLLDVMTMHMFGNVAESCLASNWDPNVDDTIHHKPATQVVTNGLPFLRILETGEDVQAKKWSGTSYQSKHLKYNLNHKSTLSMRRNWLLEICKYWWAHAEMQST